MATLVEIREQFIRQTGRYDLVVDSVAWADNGADWYLKAGQRMLDQMAGQPAQTGRKFAIVSAGVYALEVENCRSVREVWVSTSESSWQLTFYEPREFRWRFPEPWGAASSGAPSAWTLGRIRSVPDGETVDKFNNYAGDLQNFPDRLSSLGIVWQPAADEELQIEVVGDFFSVELSSESSTNWWSVNQPDLLVLAAQYKLETALGNSERQGDWLSELRARLIDIEKDWIATEVWQADELRG